MSRIVVLVCWVAMLLAACTDFDPASRVTDFRLLAVASDKPYAAPGESVRFTTLSHEPFGRPVSWAWTTCPLPLDSTVNACLARYGELAAQGAAPAIAQGPDLSSYEVTVPANLLDALPEARRQNQIFGVLTIGCPGTITLRDPRTVPIGELPVTCSEFGSNQLLPFERFVVSVKRVFVFSRDKNRLPTLAGVTFDGVEWPEAEVKEVGACDFDSNSFDDCKGEKHAILPRIAGDAVEQGVSEYGTPFSEDVVLQFYATEGVFKFDAKTDDDPKNEWAARRQSAGRLVDLWIVVRDNRGGVSWIQRRVRVR